MTDDDQPEAIQKSDLRLLTYAELGEWLDLLTENVRKVCRKHCLQIDLVAPILRSGAFPGGHLASKFGVLEVLPLQYKHTYNLPRPIHRPCAIPTLARILNSPVILMADANAVSGQIAQSAAADLRAIWPDSTILFACLTLDVSLESIPGVDQLISVRRTNERRTLARDAAKQRGISSDVHVFPWEEIEEQWAEIQAAQSALGPKETFPLR